MYNLQEQDDESQSRILFTVACILLLVVSSVLLLVAFLKMQHEVEQLLILQKWKNNAQKVGDGIKQLLQNLKKLLQQLTQQREDCKNKKRVKMVDCAVQCSDEIIPDKAMMQNMKRLKEKQQRKDKTLSQFIKTKVTSPSLKEKQCLFPVPKMFGTKVPVTKHKKAKMRIGNAYQIVLPMLLLTNLQCCSGLMPFSRYELTLRPDISELCGTSDEIYLLPPLMNNISECIPLLKATPLDFTSPCMDGHESGQKSKNSGAGSYQNHGQQQNQLRSNQGTSSGIAGGSSSGPGGGGDGGKPPYQRPNTNGHGHYSTDGSNSQKKEDKNRKNQRTKHKSGTPDQPLYLQSAKLVPTPPACSTSSHDCRGSDSPIPEYRCHTNTDESSTPSPECPQRCNHPCLTPQVHPEHPNHQMSPSHSPGNPPLCNCILPRTTPQEHPRNRTALNHVYPRPSFHCSCSRFCNCQIHPVPPLQHSLHANGFARPGGTSKTNEQNPVQPEGAEVERQGDDDEVDREAPLQQGRLSPSHCDTPWRTCLGAGYCPDHRNLMTGKSCVPWVSDHSLFRNKQSFSQDEPERVPPDINTLTSKTVEKSKYWDPGRDSRNLDTGGTEKSLLNSADSEEKEETVPLCLIDHMDSYDLSQPTTEFDSSGSSPLSHPTGDEYDCINGAFGEASSDLNASMAEDDEPNTFRSPNTSTTERQIRHASTGLERAFNGSLNIRRPERDIGRLDRTFDDSQTERNDAQRFYQVPSTPDSSGLHTHTCCPVPGLDTLSNTTDRVEPIFHRPDGQHYDIERISRTFQHRPGLYTARDDADRISRTFQHRPGLYNARDDANRISRTFQHRPGLYTSRDDANRIDRTFYHPPGDCGLLLWILATICVICERHHRDM